uniref:non-specific serine/threonine protein kinase n=1 Tax=Romanomermis culicivorax TaxID=13658 RepID=A0A915IJQ5_ROMCU
VNIYCALQENRIINLIPSLDYRHVGLVQPTPGQGGFGAVFEVLDLRTKQTRAMKIELQAPDPDEVGLALEVGVLRRMQRSRHFPKFVHTGVHKKLTYLVMQICGDNLWYLVRKCRRKRFTLSTVAQLSLQTLQAIRELHHAELLHRDIKPENFLMGRGPADKRLVYLLDFGLVRRYKFKGKIRPARPVAAFRGTLVYASPRVLSNQDAGRCDDLMSWLYVMIELLKSTLPWSDVDMNRKKLYEFKVSSVKDLLADAPNEFTQIHAEINRMGYADSPPYGKIRRLIKQMMLNGKVNEGDPFDFEPGGSEYEAVFAKIEERRTIVKRKRVQEAERRQSKNDDITMKSFRFQ